MRIAPLEPTEATGKAKQLYDAVKTKLGIVPNMMRVMGVAPAALEGYLNLSGALAGGVLNAKVREQIALDVAESNMCDYCLSAHTFLGNKVGLSTTDISEARHATSADKKTAAILKLARNIVIQRGEITDAELQTARDAGISDAEIIEIVANIAVNVLTNYLNRVAGTVVDFPVVKPGI
jgi:uncharacterized peroxidase-related enzyme